MEGESPVPHRGITHGLAICGFTISTMDADRWAACETGGFFWLPRFGTEVYQGRFRRSR